MQRNLITNYDFLLFPILILGTMIGLALYAPITSTLALGITLDLTLTMPIVYFLLIQTHKIPKTTVVPVFVIGLLIAGIILPEGQQSYLDWIKKWCLPFVELGVLGYVMYKVYTISNLLDKEKSDDLYTQVLTVVQSLVPKKFSYVVASELLVPYYCFGGWKKRPLSTGEYSYHQKSGSVALLWALVMIVVVELFALHLLLGLWSPLVAWCFSCLSLYTCMQIIALIRSMPRRPIVMTETHLVLRYGTAAHAMLQWENIVAINNYKMNDNIPVTTLSPLGELERPNVALTLREKTTIHLVLGKEVATKQVAFYIDDLDVFKIAVEKHLSVIA